MISIFQERNPFQVFFLLIITVFAKLVFILHPMYIQFDPHNGVLPAALNTWNVKGIHSTFFAFLAILLHFGCALYANAVMMGQRMYPKQNLLVAVSMVLMGSFVPAANTLSAPLILLPLLIWIYQKITGFARTEKAAANLFNVGIAVGVGSLLFHPFILVFFAVVLALAIMRTFYLKEWLILLLGLLAPCYFYLAFMYLSNAWHPAAVLPTLHFSVGQISHGAYSLLGFGMLILWLVLGLFCWRANLSRMLIQVRKNWTVLIVMVMLGLGFVFIKTGTTMDIFALSIFPLSVFAASLFIYPKKTFFPVFIFWIIILVLMIICLRHYEAKWM